MVQHVHQVEFMLLGELQVSARAMCSGQLPSNWDTNTRAVVDLMSLHF